MAKYKSVNPGPNDFDPEIGPEFKCIGRDLVVIERKLQASVKANRTFPLVCQCRSPIYPPPGEFAEAMTKTNVPVVFKAIRYWNIIIEIEPKVVGGGFLLGIGLKSETKEGQDKHPQAPGSQLDSPIAGFFGKSDTLFREDCEWGEIGMYCPQVLFTASVSNRFNVAGPPCS
jgi:hypothetical protein